MKKGYFTSAKALYVAVGILFLTASSSYYLDFKFDALNDRGLEIRVGLEKINRLNFQVTDALLLAVSESNLERAGQYDALLLELADILGKVKTLSPSQAFIRDMAATYEANDRLAVLEDQALQLMRKKMWAEARAILYGQEYLHWKKVYTTSRQKAELTILKELDETEQWFSQMKKAAFYIRIGALLFLLWVGILFSRRTRADLVEQKRLQSEIEASNADLEKRIADRTEELQTSSVEQEERANLEAVLSSLNARLQTTSKLSEVAKQSLDTLVAFFRSPKGAIFTLGEAERFHRQATFAFPEKDNSADSFGPGEGTVGKCALQGEPILTTPSDKSFWIHFGIGSAPPLQVLTYPLKASGALVGVVELCLMEPMAERQWQWLEKAAESMATAIRVAQEKEERHKAEERIHLILASTDEGIFGMDPKGYITFVNPSAGALLGYEGQDIIGKHFHTLFHHSHADGRPYPADQCRMQAAFRGEKLQGIDNEVFWRADGTMLPVEYSATPIFQENEVIGSVISFRDITERQEMEASLRRSEQRSRLILNSAGDGIFGVDTAGQVTFFNQAAENLLGYSTEELSGQELHSLIHHSCPDGTPNPKENCLMVQAYSQGKPGQTSNEVLWHKDGSRIMAEYTVTPIRDDQDHLVGAVMVFRDISERKRFEMELQQRAQELEDFNKVMIGRESRVIELKEEINALCEELGRSPAYPPLWDETAPDLPEKGGDI